LITDPVIFHNDVLWTDIFNRSDNIFIQRVLSPLTVIILPYDVHVMV
jgi:hypothetical protein